MLKRLPISLKIDDEDGDFYYGLIEEKRKNRELTTLILNLLKLYHTDAMVRKAADDFITSQNPYLRIHEELQRITLEHRKQTTATSMLGDFTRNERKKVEVPEYEYEDEEVSENKEKGNQHELILSLQEQINQLTKIIQNQSVEKVSTPEVINIAPDVTSIINSSNVNVIEHPVLSKQEEKPEQPEQKKAVPKSFKKMMNSVQ